MTQPPPNAHSVTQQADSLTKLRAIGVWLEGSAQPNLTDELEALMSRELELRACDIEHALRSEMLGRIYCRTMVNVEKLLPALTKSSFPPPRKLRQTTQTLQDLLYSVAEGLTSSCMIEATPEARERSETALWQAMNAISYHLLISHLAAMQTKGGVWQLLHMAYKRASDQGIASQRPAGTSSSYQEIYFATILAACSQPASFSSRETRFLADYLLRHSSLVKVLDQSERVSTSTFWIDSKCDAPATPCSRKTAPPETEITYFDCDHLATLAVKQLAALRSGLRPESIGLDGFAGTPAGRGSLRRLVGLFQNTGKRRFPRRRQHYRAVVCAGLENLWRLFTQGSDLGIETSSWMITNESPVGYLIMHVLGDSSDVSLGDIVAIKAEDGDKWQVCITRWARSENQEHLEFGLQILAISAIPALASTTEGKERLCNSRPRPALILPKVPPLRIDDMLVTPSGFLDEQPTRIVLVIEQGNIEVREVRNTQIDEQTAHVEVFLIEPDIREASPDYGTAQMEKSR